MRELKQELVMKYQEGIMWLDDEQLFVTSWGMRPQL